MDSFSYALLASQTGLWDWPDITRAEMWWSDSFFDFLGFNPDEVAPDINNFLQNVHPKDIEIWKNALGQCKGTEDQQKFELRIRTGNGDYQLFTVLAKAFDDNEGKVRLSGSIQNNIRKRTEKEFVRHTEEMLLKIQNTALIGFWEYDIQSQEVTWSNQSYVNFGLLPQNNISNYQELLKLIHPDYLEYHNQVTKEMIRYGQREFEYPIITPSGEKRWIWGIGEVFKNEDGEPIKLFGILQNITERKKREVQLNDQEFLLNEVGRLAKIGGWRFNVKTGEGRVTEEVAKIHDLTPEEFHSAQLGLSFFSGKDQKKIEKAIERAINKKIPYDLELQMTTKKGVKKWIRTIGYPVISEEGIVTELKGSFQDISDRKSEEENVIKSRNRLRVQTEVYTELLTKGTWLRSDFKDGIAEIIENCAELVQTDRVSVWWFDEMYSTLTCFNAYHRGSDDHLVGEQIFCSDFPNYTKRLINGKTINSSNVFKDKYANEIPHEYYKKYGIKSLLDVPIWFQGKVGGIICFEETKNQRNWTAEDERLALSMATLVSLCYETFERKKAESELRDQENRLRLALQAAKQGIFDLNIKTGEAIVNDEYATMLGYNPKTFHETNQFWIDRLHPDDTARVEKTYLDYIHSRMGEYSVEFRQKTKAGKWKWIHAFGKIVEYSKNKEPLRMLGIHTDIHERKLAEKKLSEYNKRLEIFRQIYKDIIASIEPEKIAESVLRKINELVPNELAVIGLFQENFKKVQVYSVVNKTEKLLESGELFNQEMTDRMKQLAKGSVLIVNDLGKVDKLTSVGKKMMQMGLTSHISIPLRAQKNIFGVLTIGSKTVNYFTNEKSEILSEIADQLAISIYQTRLSKQIEEYNIQLEKRVKERTSQLEKANKELESFSYSVSHDLRTPVRAINGYSNMLLEDYKNKLDNEGTRLLHVVVENTDRMKNLIDDILSLTKISRKQLSRDNVDLNKIVQECIKDLDLEIANRNIEWKVDNLPVIYSDQVLIKQLYMNLISNAAKFTKEKEKAIIELGCGKINKNTVYFVKDNGVGFDMKFASKLFQAFQRLHGIEEFEGTGVGLAIVRRIVEKYSGKVWAESVKGEGATFRFTLQP